MNDKELLFYGMDRRTPDIVYLDVFRFAILDSFTMGILYINGDPFCFTLEDPVRDINKDGDLLDAGEEKVYGNTAIPSGIYDVTLQYSPRFKRTTPRLNNVSGFTGVLIHGGNTTANTKGCILVAYNANIRDKRIQGTAEKDITSIISKYKEVKLKITDGIHKNIPQQGA